MVSQHLSPYILSGEMPQKTTIGILVQSWSRANSLTGYIAISFCSLYLGIICIILVCTLLGFQQLSVADKNRRRYLTLRNLGISESELKHLVQKEMALFFMVLLILQFIITMVSMAGLNVMYGSQMAGRNLIIQYAALAMAIFILIYAVYFSIITLCIKSRCWQ